MARRSGNAARKATRDRAIEIPLLVFFPFRLETGGLVLQGRTRNVDIWPTVYELLGLVPPTPAEALDGVSLTVYKGEAFGVIGNNGAGKSTLLRVLAGTLPPDTGTVDVYGSTPSLLALGVGFNRLLSGRRNVYLGGLAAGLRKAEIEKYPVNGVDI